MPEVFRHNSSKDQGKVFRHNVIPQGVVVHRVVDSLEVVHPRPRVIPASVTLSQAGLPSSFRNGDTVAPLVTVVHSTGNNSVVQPVNDLGDPILDDPTLPAVIKHQMLINLGFAKEGAPLPPATPTDVVIVNRTY